MKKIFLLFSCVFSICLIHAQIPVCTYLFDGNGLDAIDTNHLVLNNVTYTTDYEGIANKAALFNGVNSYAKVPVILPNPMSEFRLSLWFKTNGHQKGGGLAWAGISLVDNPVSNYTPLLYIDTFGKLNTFLYDGSAVPIKSTVSVNDDNWHHALVAYSINTTSGALIQQLFLDGNNVDTKSSTISGVPLYNNIYIGACDASNIGDVPNGWMHFNGAIDEVNMYTQVLGYDTWSNLMFKLTNKPTNRNVDEGFSGLFTTISHTNFLSQQMYYVWKKDTTIIQSDTFMGSGMGLINLTNTLLTQAGNYTCEVSNPYGKKLISQIAVLTVNDTSSTGTSVRDINDINQITLYPNPVYDYIYLNNLPKDAEATLFSLDGKQIKNVLMNDYNHVIEVADLQKGVYVLSVKTPSGYWNSRFIKD